MAADWSAIITAICGVGASVLTLFKKKDTGPSQDTVSNSGFWINSSTSTGGVVTTRINPLVWIIAGLAAILLWLGFKRRRR